MLIVSLLLIGGWVTTSANLADTTAAVWRVSQALDDYYYRTVIGGGPGLPGATPRQAIGDRLGWTCTPDTGVRSCFGGDWVRGFCPPDVRCHPANDGLLEVLGQSARESPESGFVTGQAVFAFARFGRHLDAMQIAEDCEAAAWWCAALTGHVYRSVERLQDAERSFRRSLAAAPDSIACRYPDATWLLGSWFRRGAVDPPEAWENWSKQPCSVRTAVSDTIWWLADPLYVVEGNDRWVEQIDRHLRVRWGFEAALDYTRRPSLRDSWRKDGWEVGVRRGPPDSFEYFRVARAHGAAGSYWTSKKAARYHFVPDFEGEGFSHPTWRLEADFDDEGYTPPYAPFYALPIQIARFRKPDSTGDASASTTMRVATASSALGTSIEAAADSAHLILTDAPGSFPLHLEAPFHEGKTVYLAETPPKRYVTSLEVLTPAGIGWHREMLEPMELDGPGLSDILLYEPLGFATPDSLLAATSMMLGTTELEDVPEVGLYWEVYGAEAKQPLEFQLRLERDGGGFFDKLRRLLPGGPEEATGTVIWNETATGPVSANSIVLDLKTLDAGSYTLVLRARWEGQELVESRRKLVIR